MGYSIILIMLTSTASVAITAQITEEDTSPRMRLKASIPPHKTRVRLSKRLWRKVIFYSTFISFVRLASWRMHGMQMSAWSFLTDRSFS